MTPPSSLSGSALCTLTVMALPLHICTPCGLWRRTVNQAVHLQMFACRGLRANFNISPEEDSSIEFGLECECGIHMGSLKTAASLGPKGFSRLSCCSPLTAHRLMPLSQASPPGGTADDTNKVAISSRIHLASFPLSGLMNVRVLSSHGKQTAHGL